MFAPTKGWFRDFTCFSAFLVVFSSLLESGYGQQATPARPSPVSGPTSAADRTNRLTDPAGPQATNPHPDAPPAQTPDFRDVISVGRTLSALSVSSVANNTLTITYTVYNLRGDAVAGTLLTTTLQAGISYQSGTPAPDRNGQQLVFSLGALAPLGSATAQLTVTLPTPIPTQIDSGATAFAYWNGRSVQSTALAATLRSAAVNANLLQSTVDANTGDPFIAAEAAQLGNDPNRIFQFVRDQIGYESYPGALRGARGTLWSMAGNSLDKASLLVALLRVSGIPAQWAAGTLPLAQAKQLILSMFPAQLQLTGFVAPGATVSDPANDPKLQGEAQAHYWVQFDNGTGTLVDADPDFAGAQIGQTLTTTQNTFAAVPDTMHHQVAVKLNVEVYQPGLFGPTQGTSTPLQHTFTSVELVGHPLTLGHLVNTQTSGFILSATSNTYSPYLVVGQNDLTPDNDPLIRGTDYQEVLTNFPFGTQVITGMFLEFDITDPSGNTTTSSHTVVDRIGFAARHGLAAGNVSLPANPPPVVSQYDNTTISIESSLTDNRILGTIQAREQQLAQQGAALPPAPTTSADAAAVQAYITYGQQRLVSLTQSSAANFTLVSQYKSGIGAGRLAVKSYFDSPRVVMTSASVNEQKGSVQFSMDLTKDAARVIGVPGQDVNHEKAYHTGRGLEESAVERATLATLVQGDSSGLSGTTISVVDVFSTAKAQNIPFLEVEPSNIGQLDNTTLSANAKALITDAVGRGQMVLVPSQPVSLGGQLVSAWYEIDPNTGATIDTTEFGAHQALSEYVAVILAHVLIGVFLLQFFNTLKGYAPKGRLGDCIRCALDIGAISLDAYLATLGSFLGVFFFALEAWAFLVDAAFFANDVKEGFEDCKKCATGEGGEGGSGAGGEAINPITSAATPSLNSRATCARAAIVLAGKVVPNSSISADPPANGGLSEPITADSFVLRNTAPGVLTAAASISAGAIAGQLSAVSVRATNQISATWSSTSLSSIQVTSLTAAGATVKNGGGQTVGTGAVSFSATLPVPATVSGSTNFSISGVGDLSFYGAAASPLGVSGNWTNYSGTLSGSPAVQISTGALTVGGAPLPPGVYTITAASIVVAGAGPNTSPNFAASANLNVTAGSVYVGPASGTLTSNSTAVDPANGVAFDGYTGSVAIAGSGLSDTVTLAGAATNLLRVAASPATFTTDQNTPVTFATVLQTSLADTYDLVAEAPPGWTVSIDAQGNVTATPASGLQTGTFPVYVTAFSRADRALVGQGSANVTLTGTQPHITLKVTADPTFSVPVGNAQLTSAYQAQIQNLGPLADTFKLTFPTPLSGFTLVASESSILIPAGAIATVGVYLTPNGNLPAPGTVVPFSVVATSATNSAITASSNLSFTVPAVQALVLSASPASLTGTPGSSGNSTLTLQSAGNVPVTATLAASSAQNLSLTGLTASITLPAGQTATQNLTLTAGAAASVGIGLSTTITGTYGDPSNPLTSTATLTFLPTAAQAQAASQGATAASTLGRNDIATTLSGLSNAINTVVSSCSTQSQGLLLAYVDNLIKEMNAPFLQSFVSQLQSAQAAISSATCTNIGAALTQLSNVLAGLDTALSSPAAFPFNVGLQPNTAVAQPNQATQFLVLLQNNSTSTNTYALSLGTLPTGVTGGLDKTSVTLAPGATTAGTGSPVITLTPSTATGGAFSVTASVNGVAGSAQTANGTLTARSEFLRVQDVKANPAFVNSGTSVDVIADLANEVNTPRSVQVVLVVQDKNGATVLTPPPQNVQLSVQTLLTAVDFGQISTQGLANGTYTLAVTVKDPTSGQTLPGGTGSGVLLIGAPVTASLTLTPTTLAPGSGKVTTTLSVSSNNVNNGGAPFSLLGSVPLASGANTIALNGNTAYSCDQNEVSIIDVTDPTNLKLLGTALSGSIMNAANIFCSIQRGDLVMLADTGSTLTSGGPAFVAFDLTDPLHPSLIKSTPVNKRFFSNPFYQSNYALFGTNSVSYFPGPGTVVDQFGDFVSLNVADFTNPFVAGTLEQPQRDAVAGGAFNTYGAVQGPGQIAYVGATTSQGGNTAQGNGQLWVVDTSDPTHLSFIKQIDVPGTRQTAAPFVQGNIAVSVSNSLGWRNPGFGNGMPAQTGNLVITVFDITDPRNPQIVSNTTTTLIPGLGNGGAIIGNNLFLVTGQEDAGGNNILFTIDTTDPHNLVIKTYPVPANINGLVPRGNILYAATSDHGFQTYSIPGTGTLQYTATIQAAKSGGVVYDATSFSTPPTTITPGATFDTLTWVNPPSSTITFSSNVTGIQAGQVLPVDFGGSVSFVSNQGPGSDTLPPLNVNSAQILGINPASQTVAPGGSASYTITASNPTASAVTYNLSIAGIPSRWVTLPATVNVPASGSTNVTLTLQTAFADIASTNGFQVTASAGSASGSVNGTLLIQGTANIGTVTNTGPVGVVVTLTPASATGGQGTTANYVVQVTNTGSASDTYTMSATLPAGVTATLDQTNLPVPPGLSNFRQVNLHLLVPRGASGSPTFTVKATSNTSAAITGQATGTLNIVGAGVNLAFSPSSTAPNGTLQLTVTNTGTATDTFDLALGGATAVFAHAAVSSVTLAPGASQNVAVTIGQVAAPPGNLALFAIGMSRANTSVSAAAQATVVVPASSGVSAIFSPSQQGLAAPGPAIFLLEMQNTGNIEDSYQATITGTTGPITASLVDITGQSVQTTSTFLMPGLALGQLTLNTTLTGNAQSTVTVKVTSTTNPAITSTAVATLQFGALAVPVANAGKNHNAPTGHWTLLDGSQSYDPGGSRITYAWSLVSKPARSSLTGPTPVNGVQPDFQPDVDGVYTFQLIVSNGPQTSAPSTVQFTAFTGNVPPNADAGKPHNGVLGKSVGLDGSSSFDPDQSPQPLSYLWQMQQAPNGSAVGNGSISNATQAKAGFTPDVAGIYILSLRASDGAAASTDTVTITVAATDAPPNAIAGVNRRVLPGAPVSLDGSGSFDPDGQSLSFQWQFSSGVLDNPALQGASTAKPGLTPATAGYYVTRLTVNDGVASSDNVTVLATTACDANGDGLVNQVDFDLMAQISGQAAFPGDPLDVNGDGVIDGKDIAICQQPAPPPPVPSFNVDQTVLVFDYVSGDAKPPAPQIVNVTSSGGTLGFVVNTNGATWVSANPSSGNTNTAVQITIDPSKVGVGNFSAVLTFAARQPANPGSVNVTIVAHIHEPPRLTLAPAVLNFQYQQGSSTLPAAQTVSVVAVTRNLAFTAQPSANWIVTSPASATTPSIETVSLANLGGMGPARYQGNVTFTPNDGSGPPQVVQVNLVILPAPPAITAAGVTNAASGATGPVAPGEIVNVSGMYFGPAQLVKADTTGIVSPGLADTQVLFEGVPAAVLSVVAGLVQAIVPFYLDGRAAVSVQVIYKGIVSNTVTLPVAKAQPGVYTANGNGTGQAMALNADGSQNSSGNPVAGGTKLTFYLTGGGMLNPPGFDGRIAAAPLSALAQDITVQIGGQTAQATAGDSVGMVEGFVQVDVTVPQNLPPGNAVLLVTIGGVKSQPGVTVAVH